MRQLQYSFSGPEDTAALFPKIKENLKDDMHRHLLFHVYSASLDRDAAEKICSGLRESFPGVDFVGCSTAGNLIGGNFCPDPYALTCTIYESGNARTAVRQYQLGRENVDEVTREVVDFANSNLWVKAVMLYTTVWENSMSSLCSSLDSVREGVEIMGGGAFNNALDSSSSFVFSSVAGPADNSIVFVFVGGSDFSIKTRYVSGWKPLGKEMRITGARGNVLAEIDGMPAFETYRRYLKIDNDDTFLYNTLEFPYMIRNHGIEILRHPQQCLEDGSLVMASDVEEARTIHMAYGDPVTIMENVFQNALEISREEPDVIAIFSCAGRKSFWGDSEIGNETKAFQSIAPSSGFYTLSEFLRTGEHVNQHNLTLVIASMKEDTGEKAESSREKKAKKTEQTTRRISTVERLANFIEEATRELETANRQLSEMNQKLSDAAITDGMTGLFNRTEIQRRITEAVETGKKNGADRAGTVSLIMIDIDDFKKVNDSYGHKEGDVVICALGYLMQKVLKKKPSASVGRWGGEEFMILMPGYGQDEAKETAEKIRMEFEGIVFPQAGHKSVSVGVTENREGEDADSIVLRADQALYMAKGGGKNRTVVL